MIIKEATSAHNHFYTAMASDTDPLLFMRKLTFVCNI